MVEVARAAPLEPGDQCLVGAAVEPDEAPARAERQPVQVDRRGRPVASPPRASWPVAPTARVSQPPRSLRSWFAIHADTLPAMLAIREEGAGDPPRARARRRDERRDLASSHAAPGRAPAGGRSRPPRLRRLAGRGSGLRARRGRRAASRPVWGGGRTGALRDRVRPGAGRPGRGDGRRSTRSRRSASPTPDAGCRATSVWACARSRADPTSPPAAARASYARSSAIRTRSPASRRSPPRPPTAGSWPTAEMGQTAIESFLAAAAGGVQGMVGEGTTSPAARRGAFDLRDVLGARSTSATSERDRFVPVEHARALAAALPHRRAQFDAEGRATSSSAAAWRRCWGALVAGRAWAGGARLASDPEPNGQAVGLTTGARAGRVSWGAARTQRPGAAGLLGTRRQVAGQRVVEAGGRGVR